MASANSALVQMQKLANQTQVKLQEMVNNANSSQMAYNADEAQKSRDWQTWMSQNAHQMEVQDLKKAGLNPVLSSGGSGAQSYTTSSASTQNESGANALASVQSSQLGAIGSMESSRISAAAQRAAAAQAAAATRAAAAAAAGAQMYAADKAYSSAKVQADAKKFAATTSAEASKWIAQNKQTNTPWAMFDKYATKLLQNLPKNINVSGFLGKAKGFASAFDSNPSKYIKNYSSATANNFKLTDAGVNKANSVLSSMGIAQTKANRKLVVQAYWSGNQSAYLALLKKVPQTKIVATTKPGWR